MEDTHEDPAILGALVLASLSAMPALAENLTRRRSSSWLTKLLKTFTGSTSAVKESLSVKRRLSSPGDEPGIGSLPEVGKERRTNAQPALSFGSTGSGRLCLCQNHLFQPRKPLWAVIWTFSIVPTIKGVLETGGFGSGTTNGFDQQRFVPFIYADITEHVKFASEIEIEHGIRETSDNEISLEFAHIDYLVHEPFNLRAGICSFPIGKFNLLHDSLLNDLQTAHLSAN